MPQGQKNQNINRHNIATDSIKTKIMRADFCRAKSWRRQEELSSSPQMEQVIFTTKMKLTDKGRNLLYLVVERSSNVLCLFFNFLSEMSE